MSLFKLKTIWNANFPQQQFDQRHLTLGIINRSPAITIGSYKGILRVYIPSNKKNSKQLFKLIFQKNFQQPIIDIKYVSHPDQSIKNNTIGVLLFKKFVYVTLQPRGQSLMYGSKIMNVDCHPSFAILQSPLSVVTLNSSIQTLNPQQLHPIKQSDPIYAFASFMNDFYYMDGQDLVKCKGDIQQWRIIIGRVRSIYIVKDIIVLIGERQLWEVQEGKIHKCKRLEEEVSAGALAYKSKTDYNIIISNFIMQTLIYSSDYLLLWAIKLDYLPIRIIVCQHQSIKGALLFLTDQGSVQLTYAGTQIQQRKLKPLQQQVNMQRVQKQTSYFLQRIKQLKSNPQAQADKINLKSKEVSSDNVLSVKLLFSQPQQTDEFIDKNNELYRSPSNKLIKCTLSVELLAQSTQLTNVLILIVKPNNIYVQQEQKSISTLKGKQIVKFDCFISNQKFPYHSTVKIQVRYQKGKSTKFIQKQIIIPIKFQCKIASFEALQKTQHKITFKCTDDPLPTFNQLFSDIIERGSGEQKKAITFLLVNGIKTSIVYNKNLSKVKIETQVYSGFCYIFLQFMRRLQNYLKKQNKKLSVQINEIPLKQIANQLQEYYSCRQQVKIHFKQLQIKTQQFKKSQKKLLLKMKQKNSSLEHISKLLQFTYNRVLQSVQKHQAIVQESNIANHNFQVSLKFVMQFVYYRSNASENAIRIAESIIKFDGQNQNGLDQQSWGQKLTKNASYYLNKKYDATVQNLQKLITWVIAKINSGQWN